MDEMEKYQRITVATITTQVKRMPGSVSGGSNWEVEITSDLFRRLKVHATAVETTGHNHAQSIEKILIDILEQGIPAYDDPNEVEDILNEAAKQMRGK